MSLKTGTTRPYFFEIFLVQYSGGRSKRGFSGIGCHPARKTASEGAGNDALRSGDDDTLIGGLGADSVFGDSCEDLGLGGTGVKGTCDILNVSVETINEAFAKIFCFD